MPAVSLPKFVGLLHELYPKQFKKSDAKFPRGIVCKLNDLDAQECEKLITLAQKRNIGIPGMYVMVLKRSVKNAAELSNTLSSGKQGDSNTGTATGPSVQAVYQRNGQELDEYEDSNKSRPSKFTIGGATQKSKPKMRLSVIVSDDDGCEIRESAVSLQKSALTGFKSKWIKTKAGDKSTVFGEGRESRESEDSFQSCGRGGLGDVLAGKPNPDVSNIIKAVRILREEEQPDEGKDGCSCMKVLISIFMLLVIVWLAVYLYETKVAKKPILHRISAKFPGLRKADSEPAQEEQKPLLWHDRINPLKSTSGKIAGGLAALGSLGGLAAASRKHPIEESLYREPLVNLETNSGRATATLGGIAALGIGALALKGLFGDRSAKAEAQVRMKMMEEMLKEMQRRNEAYVNHVQSESQASTDVDAVEERFKQYQQRIKSVQEVFERLECNIRDCEEKSDNADSETKTMLDNLVKQLTALGKNGVKEKRRLKGRESRYAKKLERGKAREAALGRYSTSPANRASNDLDIPRTRYL